MRRFVALAFATALVSSGAVAEQSPAARIKIDIDRAIGEIHPHLFGNFAEHLGRMIYGGVYDEKSPLSDVGDDKKIRPVTRPLGADAGSRNIRYTFPAHSLTILRFKLQ